MHETYLQQFLSDAARRAKRSEIRELLKLIARPEVISLAGGLPDPETFPVEEMAGLLPEAVRRYGKGAFQYGATEGDPELVRELIALGAADGLPDLTPEQVLVVSGSQQGLDLVSRIFLAPGDAVVCGLPSYLGALGAFTACGARMAGIPLDEHGLRPDLLEERLVELRREGIRPKLLYVVPDFQNPAGVTLPLARRRDLLAIASEFDLLVLEDSPYRQLRYTGETVPVMKSLDREGRVISLFTFSKILFPGLRIGWVVAAPEIVSRLTVAKQPVDLCTSPFAQLAARMYLATGRLPDQIARIRALYAEKRTVFLRALGEHVDPAWGVRWTEPEGGLFLWMQLPAGLDAKELLQEALQENVAFVIGNAFHCDGEGKNTLRLNFSYPTPDQLEEAARRLGRAIGRMVAARPSRPSAPPVPSPRVPSPAAATHSLEQLSWNLALTELVE